MKTRILFIDDDQQTLDSYKEALAPRSAQWEIECHTKVPAALESIKAQAPSIVIADFKIETENGVDVLKQVEAIDPDIQRFITTTVEEKEQIESSIGSAYQFLPKPSSGEKLITEIQRCLAIDSWLGNHRVKEIISKMGDFPSLPPMYLKVVNALNNRNSSAAQIGHAISGDLAISAKVLQVVNSSYFGLDEKTSDITQAVGILGVENVKHLVLAIQVFGSMGRSPDQKALTDQLWHHSMSVAVTAKRIMQYETNDEKYAEEAYTAGLLHDIGKLVLINSVPEEFQKARELAREKLIPLWQAETEIIGCNHAETGAYLLGRWGMPAPVVEAVALHHEPVNTFGTAFSCLSAVHVGNALVWERNPGDTPHPDSLPEESFLAEIGKASSWSEWQEVASGKRTEKPKRQSSSPKSDDTNEDSESQTTAAKTSGPQATSKPGTISQTSSAATSEKKKNSSNLAPIGVLLAACLGVAAGIYYLSSMDSPSVEAKEAKVEPIEKAEPKSELASAIDQAKEVAESGTAWAKELDEVIEDSEPEKTPEAEVAETPAADEIAKVEETQPTPLPQPKLPKQEDLFPKITLAGIFYNANNPLASVNGKIRREGDTFGGVKIERIEPKRIIVRYEGKLKAFKLN